MGGKKKTQTCGYAKPHPSHVWNRDGRPIGEPQVKRFCPGVAQKAASAHVHIWDAASGPIMREREIDAPGLLEVVSEPYQGPIECPCGQSAWLKDGVKKRLLAPKEVRFPMADIMERTLALKAKLDSGGPDSLSEEDKAEFEAIAAALVEAFKPLVEAFQKMAEQVIEFLATFLDRLDPDVVRELHRLAQTYGEHAESAPDTIELRDSVTGGLISEEIIGYDPISAQNHAGSGIVEDSVQMYIDPRVSSEAAVEAARRAIQEPFTEPFRVNRGRW